VEESSCGLIEAFAWRACGEPPKLSVIILDISTEIRIEQLSNTSQERYFQIGLLRECVLSHVYDWNKLENASMA
jgi:hypothetical protein